MNTETENYYYFVSAKIRTRHNPAKRSSAQIPTNNFFVCPLIRLFNKFKRLNVNFGVLDVLL